MTVIRLALATLALSTLPALAGPGTFDLPRLDFGTPRADVTQSCADATRPGAPAGCVATR